MWPGNAYLNFSALFTANMYIYVYYMYVQCTLHWYNLFHEPNICIKITLKSINERSLLNRAKAIWYLSIPFFPLLKFIPKKKNEPVHAREYFKANLPKSLKLGKITSCKRKKNQEKSCCISVTLLLHMIKTKAFGAFFGHLLYGGDFPTNGNITDTTDFTKIYCIPYKNFQIWIRIDKYDTFVVKCT